jgi:hypothetical protein
MWILLIFMYTGTGEFVSKIPVTQPSQAACLTAARTLPQVLEGSDTRLEPVCVTREHWTGERYMPGIPLEHRSR